MPRYYVGHEDLPRLDRVQADIREARQAREGNTEITQSDVIKWLLNAYDAYKISNNL